MLTLALIGEAMFDRDHPQDAQIDAYALANNHFLDFEKQSLLDTLHRRKMARILHAGASLSTK